MVKFEDSAKTKHLMTEVIRVRNLLGNYMNYSRPPTSGELIKTLKYCRKIVMNNNLRVLMSNY